MIPKRIPSHYYESLRRLKEELLLHFPVSFITILMHFGMSDGIVA